MEALRHAIDVHTSGLELLTTDVVEPIREQLKENKMKAVKRFLRWLWEFIKSFNTTKGYISLFIAFTIMYGWVVAFFVIGTVTGDVYLLGIATTVAVFWAGPFTPFLPILVGLTRFIQKIILRDKAVPKHIKEKKKK